MPDRPTLDFTPALLAAFKNTVAEASLHERRTFWFMGHQFDVRYARYLVEYLEAHFHQPDSKETRP